MRKTLYFTIGAMLALLPVSWPCAASTYTLPLMELSGDSLRQQKAVKLDMLSGHKTVIVFWREDCPPCRNEMKILPNLVSQHPDITIAVIALHTAAETRQFLTVSFPPSVHILAAQGHYKELLAAYGDSRLLLPYSVALRGDGSICTQHFGILGSDMLGEWEKTC